MKVACRHGGNSREILQTPMLKREKSEKDSVERAPDCSKIQSLFLAGRIEKPELFVRAI